MQDVARDQGAIVQLTPESMDLFNAAVTDREGVAYRSLVTAAPPPPRAYNLKDIRSVATASLAGAFTLLHALTARAHPHYPYPTRSTELLAESARAAGIAVDATSNDGVVPTLSQVHGSVLDLVVADHLDICGQYPRAGEPHSDWLPSGSGYGDESFVATWERVADSIAAGESTR
jgi:hypothetical protein